MDGAPVHSFGGLHAERPEETHSQQRDLEEPGFPTLQSRWRLSCLDRYGLQCLRQRRVRWKYALLRHLLLPVRERLLELRSKLVLLLRPRELRFISLVDRSMTLPRRSDLAAAGSSSSFHPGQGVELLQLGLEQLLVRQLRLVLGDQGRVE